MARQGIPPPIKRVFDQEELAGLRLATWARTAILAVLAVQIAIFNRPPAVYVFEVEIAMFAGLGLTQRAAAPLRPGLDRLPVRHRRYGAAGRRAGRDRGDADRSLAGADDLPVRQLHVLLHHHRRRRADLCAAADGVVVDRGGGCPGRRGRMDRTVAGDRDRVQRRAVARVRTWRRRSIPISSD